MIAPTLNIHRLPALTIAGFAPFAALPDRHTKEAA